MRRILLMLLILLSSATVSFAAPYALLVNGGYGKYGNYLSFNSAIRGMYNELLDAGYDKNNIIVLDSDGPDNTMHEWTSADPPYPKPIPPNADAGFFVSFWDEYAQEYGLASKLYTDSPKDYDGDGVADTNYRATWTEFVQGVSDLAGVMTAEDTLMVYMTDHGGVRDTGFIFGMWDEVNWGAGYEADGTLIAEQLNTIPCEYKVVLLSACYSGAFAADVVDDKTVFMSACAEDEYGWTKVPIVWVGGPKAGFEDGIGFWEGAIIEGLSGPADLDDNGKITWQEVWQYGNDNDPFGTVLGPYIENGYEYPIEHSQYSDTGGHGDGVYRLASPGDTNWDNIVDGADLSVLLTNWHGDGGWSDGDFTGDGYVGDNDLAVVLANWTGMTPAYAAGIPEPVTLAYLAIGGIMIVGFRRKKTENIKGGLPPKEN